MAARAFKTRDAFRAWLEKHHASTNELMLRLFKVHASRRGIGYKDALDEALCFGWIDGVRRGLDEDSFTTRFTPRRPKSNWSSVNIRRVTELEAEGRMRPAGLAAFRARGAPKPAPYSYESAPRELAPAFQKRLRANKVAWDFWTSEPPGRRRISAFWVMEAKRPETREKRFAILLEKLAQRRPVGLLERNK